MIADCTHVSGGIEPRASLTGDTDQAINYCYMAVEDARAAILFFWPDVVLRTKPVSLRLFTLAIDYANTKLIERRDELGVAQSGKPPIQCAPDAIQGEFVLDATLKSCPIDPSVRTGFICRRALELWDLFSILVSLGHAPMVHASTYWRATSPSLAAPLTRHTAVCQRGSWSSARGNWKWR